MKQSASFQGLNIDKNSIINLEKGKLPPQATDLEEVVLGAMMIDKKGVDEVIDLLTSEAFYKETHQLIFQAIFTLFQKSEPIDLLTVSNQLKKDNNHERIGGDFYLISLTQKVSSSAHIEFHARIILQKFIQRSLIKISNEIITDSYDESKDVFDLLDNAESKLYDVTQGNIKKSSETAQSLVIQAKSKIEAISNKKGLSGIPSGFGKIDKLTAGWQESDLVIIAARPGMGKTALALSMTSNIAIENKIPLAFFSLVLRTTMYFKPLQVFGGLSVFLILMAIITGILGKVYLGKVPDVASVSMFSTGVIFLGLGLIGDLINISRKTIERSK